MSERLTPEEIRVELDLLEFMIGTVLAYDRMRSLACRIMAAAKECLEGYQAAEERAETTERALEGLEDTERALRLVLGEDTYVCPIDCPPRLEGESPIQQCVRCILAQEQAVREIQAEEAKTDE